MTLIIGAQCRDGVVLAADRRRLARHEKGPETNKLFKMDCGVVLAGAGDDAVLNEARVFIERRVEESAHQSPIANLFDIVEVTACVVNELVSLYRDKVEEPFGFVLAGLEKVTSGTTKLYTIFGAGLSDVPWACLGSGNSYARPLVELLLVPGDLSTEEAAKTMPVIFTLVSNVQTTVGGGVDVCIVKDREVTDAIQHFGDVDLKPLRAGILNTTEIRTQSPTGQTNS